MEERFNTIANQKYEQIEKNPYKRPSSIKNKKINKIDIDYNAGPHNNDDYNLKGYNIEGGKKDKLKIREKIYFLNKNKSSLIPYISSDLIIHHLEKKLIQDMQMRYQKVLVTNYIIQYREYHYTMEKQQVFL